MNFGLPADEKTSFEIMDRALYAGIDFFDHALLMRDLTHQWHIEPDMLAEGLPQ